MKLGLYFAKSCSCGSSGIKSVRCCAGYGSCDKPQQHGEFTSVRCLGPEEQLKPGQVRTVLVWSRNPAGTRRVARGAQALRFQVACA